MMTWVVGYRLFYLLSIHPYSLNILPSITMYRDSRLSSLLPYLINRMQYRYFQQVNKPALKYIKHQEIISTTMTTKVRSHKNCMLLCQLFNSVIATIAFEKAFLYFSLKLVSNVLNWESQAKYFVINILYIKYDTKQNFSYKQSGYPDHIIYLYIPPSTSVIL